jgi:ABC-type Fe3+ transport system substrate-binding protein
MILSENKFFRWVLPCVLICFLMVGCEKAPEDLASLNISTDNSEIASQEPQDVETSELVVYYDNKPLPQTIADRFAQEHGLTLVQKKIEDNDVDDADVFIINPFTFLEFGRDVEFSEWTADLNFNQFHPSLLHHTFDSENTKTAPLMWSPYVFYTPKTEQGKNPWNNWLDYKPAIYHNDMVLLTKLRIKELEESANRATHSKFIEIKNEVSSKLAENLKTADDSWSAVQSGESHLAFLPLGYFIANPTAQPNLAFHLSQKGTLIDFPQIAIRKASRHQEKSKLLATFLTSREIQSELSKETGYFPAVVDDKRKDPWEGCPIALPKARWFNNSEYPLPVEKDPAPATQVTEPSTSVESPTTTTDSTATASPIGG